MVSRNLKQKKHILFCAEIYNSPLSRLTAELVYSALIANKNFNLILVDDLCRIAMNDKEHDLLIKLSKLPELIIVGIYPRAIKWLFKWQGLQLPQNTTYYNMITQTADEIVNELCNKPANNYKLQEYPFSVNNKEKIPWYPILDYDRCINCGQCMNFCIFGVYSYDDNGKIFVKHPENCKNNCPACARICPQIAIIFPKLKENPLNGEQINEDIQNPNLQLDLDSLLKDDLYEMLKNRQQRTKRKLLNNEAQKKAFAEREICKNKI